MYFELHNEGSYLSGPLSGTIEIFTFLGEFAKVRKATTSFVISVRPSSWNDSAPTGRIFMKFDI